MTLINNHTHHFKSNYDAERHFKHHLVINPIKYDTWPTSKPLQISSGHFITTYPIKRSSGHLINNRKVQVPIHKVKWVQPLSQDPLGHYYYSLSPVLFTIYLEAALRDLRQELPSRPAVDNDLPLDIAYADDVDFVSRDETFLSEVEQQAPAVLARWNLNVNPSKTEHTTVARFPDRNQEIALSKI